MASGRIVVQTPTYPLDPTEWDIRIHILSVTRSKHLNHVFIRDATDFNPSFSICSCNSVFIQYESVWKWLQLLFFKTWIWRQRAICSKLSKWKKTMDLSFSSEYQVRNSSGKMDNNIWRKDAWHQYGGPHSDLFLLFLLNKSFLFLFHIVDLFYFES